MTSFAFQGRGADGQAVDGIIEANSALLAASMLRQRGLVPVQITPASEPAPGWRARLMGESRVRGSDLAILTRQLYTLLRAGVPVISALQALARSSPNVGLKALVADVINGLNEGLELSQALARRRDVFDSFFLAMVRIGETAGKLPEVFKALYNHLEFQRVTREQVAAALRYPKFVLMAMAIAVTVINVFVVPSFAQIFANAKVELPLVTRLLLASSDFFTRGWPLLLASAGVAWASWFLWQRTATGQYWWHRQQLRLPLAGHLLRLSALARICRAMEMTLAAGVPLIQGLTLAAEVTDNRFLSARMQRVREGVERGESLLIASGQARVFTPLVLQMIAVGEETGRVDEMLGDIAESYRQEVEVELKMLSQRIEPILIIVLGVMVLVLALGVFMPMWDLGKAAVK